MLGMIHYEPQPETPPAIQMPFEATGIQRAISSQIGQDTVRPIIVIGTSFSAQLPLTKGFFTITSTGSGLPSKVMLSEFPKFMGPTVPMMLADAKRMTGWSWERLASALGRTRQAVNNWSNGLEIAVANSERVAKLHATLAYIDRGTPQATQAVLNSSVGDGKILSDMFYEERFEEIRAIAGSGTRVDVVQLTKMMADTRRASVARHGHWLDHPDADDEPFEIVPTPGEQRRVKVRRQV